MTREEANKELERAFDVLDHTCHMDNRRKEAFNMARVALSAEPCDCISRQAALEPYQILNDSDTICIWLLRKNIEQQPSVTPKPKTGHWISKHIVDDCNGVVTWYECSECGRCVDETITEEYMLKDYPYCHCGAKMLPTDAEKER